MLPHLRITRVLQLVDLLRTRPPKPVRTLAAALDISVRTVYRYLDTLREAGFRIEQDEHGRFSLSPTNGLGETLASAARARTQTLLEDAIERRRQAWLVEYASAHSGKVMDRLVHPIGFTPGNVCVVAYEPAVDRVNYYRIDRIRDVTVTDEPYALSPRHKAHAPDFFGFNFNGQYLHLEWKLSARGRILLLEQYPLAESHLSTPDDDGWHTLAAVIHDWAPARRFADGLPDEVLWIGR